MSGHVGRPGSLSLPFPVRQTPLSFPVPHPRVLLVAVHIRFQLLFASNLQRHVLPCCIFSAFRMAAHLPFLAFAAWAVRLCVSPSRSWQVPSFFQNGRLAWLLRMHPCHSRPAGSEAAIRVDPCAARRPCSKRRPHHGRKSLKRPWGFVLHEAALIGPSWSLVNHRLPIASA